MTPCDLCLFVLVELTYLPTENTMHTILNANDNERTQQRQPDGDK
jgi:hypothetical protein